MSSVTGGPGPIYTPTGFGGQLGSGHAAAARRMLAPNASLSGRRQAVSSPSKPFDCLTISPPFLPVKLFYREISDILCAFRQGRAYILTNTEPERFEGSDGAFPRLTDNLSNIVRHFS